jgi:ribosome-associated heat shock protein Hsp15
VSFKEMSETENTIRIDKWLWAARFFKTRSLASQAVNGGKVHLNGARTKSSREVKVGDRLLITKGYLEFDITIEGISKYRRPAAEAQLLYEELQESIIKRKAQIEQRRLFRAGQPAPEKKPGKRDRRKIREFTRKG